MMAAAQPLPAAGERDRHLWLLDTFAGMTPPSVIDRRVWDSKTQPGCYVSVSRARRETSWREASLDEVRTHVSSTGYPLDNCHFVEEWWKRRSGATVSMRSPSCDSTRTGASQPFRTSPLLPSGALITDDYGEWECQHGR